MDRRRSHSPSYAKAQAESTRPALSTGRRSDSATLLLAAVLSVLMLVLYFHGPIASEQAYGITPDSERQTARRRPESRDEILARVRREMEKQMEEAAIHRSTDKIGHDFSILMLDAAMITGSAWTSWRRDEDDAELIAAAHRAFEQNAVGGIHQVFPSSMYDELRQKMAWLGWANLDAADLLYSSNIAVPAFVKQYNTLARVPQKRGSQYRPSAATCTDENVADVQRWWPLWKAFVFSGPEDDVYEMLGGPEGAAVSVLATAVLDASLVAIMGESSGPVASRWDTARRKKCAAARGDWAMVHEFVANRFQGLADMFVVFNPPAELAQSPAIAQAYTVHQSEPVHENTPLILLSKQTISGETLSEHVTSPASAVIGSLLIDPRVRRGLSPDAPWFLLQAFAADHVSAYGTAFPKAMAGLVERNAHRRCLAISGATFDSLQLSRDFFLEASDDEYSSLAGPVGLPFVPGSSQAVSRKTFRVVRTDGAERGRAESPGMPPVPPPKPLAALLAQTAQRAAAANSSHALRCNPAWPSLTEGTQRVCGSPTSGAMHFEHHAADAWHPVVTAAGFRVQPKSPTGTTPSLLPPLLLRFDRFTAAADAFSAVAVDSAGNAEYTLVARPSPPTPGHHAKVAGFSVGVRVFFRYPSAGGGGGVDGGLRRKLGELPKAHEGNTDVHSVEVAFDFHPDPSEFDAGTFKWVPVLHEGRGEATTALSHASEEVYRSPAVVAAARGVGFAVVPNVRKVAEAMLDETWSVPSSLDMLSGSAARDGAPQSTESVLKGDHLPVKAYVGAASSRISRGGFPERSDDVLIFSPALHTGRFLFEFDLLVAARSAPGDLTAAVNALLWAQQAAAAVAVTAAPQVLPFAEYARAVYAAADFLTGSNAAGLLAVGGTRLAANATSTGFLGDQNDVLSAYGMLYWGGAAGNATLVESGSRVLHLMRSAPVTSAGAFPSVYNWQSSRWEGVPSDSAAPGNKLTGYDAAAMAVTRLWEESIERHLAADVAKPLFPEGSEARARLRAFARFAAAKQLADGSYPDFYDGAHRHAPCPAEPRGICFTGTTAVVGAAVAVAARRDANLTQSAIAAGEFVRRRAIEKQAYLWPDLPGAVHQARWGDGRSALLPSSTTACLHVASQMLRLFELTADAAWLASGETALQVALLNQQTWFPPRLQAAQGNFFGGFGASNADISWSAVQHRAVPVLCDYYEATKKTEYLERAVAAARASFAFLDIPQHRAVGGFVQDTAISVGRGRYPQGLLRHGWYGAPVGVGGDAADGQLWAVGEGAAPFSLVAGPSATAAAYLVRKFGAIWVDVSAERVVGIDCATVRASFEKGKLAMDVTDHCKKGNAKRALLIRFSRSPPGYLVHVNGKDVSGQLSKADLSLPVDV
ncbi:hypothetical protein DIPPA_25620 [Diplonema papillatum]|nr:hypothetical protein DIPPA_25620 [Diplonema papillatum]